MSALDVDVLDTLELLERTDADEGAVPLPKPETTTVLLVAVPKETIGWLLEDVARGLARGPSEETPAEEGYSSVLCVDCKLDVEFALAGSADAPELARDTVLDERLEELALLLALDTVELVADTVMPTAWTPLDVDVLRLDGED